MNKKKDRILHWTERLYKDLTGQGEIEKMPPDLFMTVPYALKAMEEKCGAWERKHLESLCLYYREEMTTPEIGKYFGVSSQSASQYIKRVYWSCDGTGLFLLYAMG